jgi:putative transposase
MPWSLKRYQHTGDLHFLTFSCYKRRPLLGTPTARNRFEQSLEETRRRYKFSILGYVVMPEHVHLLATEPQDEPLATAIQAVKQSVSRLLGSGEPFWQPRYYDFNVYTERKQIEKLRYLHRNPVKRGLVLRPEDWRWSSFRHHMTGETASVTVLSHWSLNEQPHPSEAKVGLFPQLLPDLPRVSSSAPISGSPAPQTKES